MNRIVARRQLAPEIVWFEVEAPRIAGRWKPGQFLIVRPNSDSERIPLTIVGSSAPLLRTCCTSSVRWQ